MATVEFDVIHVETTREEVHAELDQLAQQALDISGDEFLTRWSGGELDTSNPTVVRLGVLARLLTV